MNNKRVPWVCVAIVLATVMAVTAPVRAQSSMLVVIDASGSMVAQRDNSDGNGATRFEAAKTLAETRVQEQASVDASLMVAVYTFRGFMMAIPHTMGFVDYNTALDAIEALDPAVDIGGSTPLAGSICTGIDELIPRPGTRILQVSSDGEENTTPLGHPCQGSLYTGSPPYPATSWQARVLNHLPDPAEIVIIQVDLFDSSQIAFSAHAKGAPDPEGILTPQARLAATTPSINNGLTPLQEFFTILTQATGGRLNIIRDDAPLPVSGDLNGDRCVDRADAILVARAFGPLVPPADGRFDLNLDLTVDFTDYQIQVARITPTCGPDPYVPKAPIACKGTTKLEIDSRAIEHGGTTVYARGPCEIIIRNSLIVSGQTAITIIGSAKITIDDSIIVGQNAVIMQSGAGSELSAANTIFNGTMVFKGKYIDRGGNIFE